MSFIFTASFRMKILIIGFIIFGVILAVLAYFTWRAVDDVIRRLFR